MCVFFLFVSLLVPSFGRLGTMGLKLYEVAKKNIRNKIKW